MRWGTRLLFASLRYAPGLVRILGDLLIGRDATNKSAEELQNHRAADEVYKPMLAPCEYEAFGKPEFTRELIHDVQETLHGSPGFVRDGQLMAGPWGLDWKMSRTQGLGCIMGAKISIRLRRWVAI